MFDIGELDSWVERDLARAGGDSFFETVKVNQDGRVDNKSGLSLIGDATPEHIMLLCSKLEFLRPFKFAFTQDRIKGTFTIEVTTAK
ncbi:MAG: hypothetical protein HZB10_02325 [Candidatus Yonathbacteria bacterium]|nr:hypothetical protein [Candidatus Yonathbacteria bacterium]